MKKGKRFIFAAFFVLILTFALFYRIEKTVDVYGETVLKNAVYTRINEKICAFFSDNETLFQSIAHNERDFSGRLSAIQIDSAAVNAVRLGLEKTIASEIKQLKNEEFRMPLGNVLGIKALSSAGPVMKIKIVPLGNVRCGTVNKFESAGINHTLYRLGLNFTVSFASAPPFSGKSHETQFYVSLCENIIIGEVPRVYLK